MSNSAYSTTGDMADDNALEFLYDLFNKAQSIAEELMPTSGRATLSAVAIILLLSTFLGACGSSEPLHAGGNALMMAPIKDLPREVQSAPVTVRQAYQFAVANPELLSEIPCYCGCGGMGHGSNYACYVQEVSADGAVTFDGHALGCSICVDITQDTMRMLNEGKSLTEIQDFVDRTYARFGPSNMP